MIGTFLVAAVSAGSSAGEVGPLVWVVVGVAAAPSVALWTRCARRLGAHRVLVMALVSRPSAPFCPRCRRVRWSR